MSHVQRGTECCGAERVVPMTPRLQPRAWVSRLTAIGAMATILGACGSAQVTSPTSPSGRGSANSSESTKIQATCGVYVSEAVSLRASLADNGQAVNLLGLAAGPSSVAEMFKALSDAAPDPIRDVFSTVASNLGKATGTDIKGALASAAGGSAAFAMANQWLDANCPDAGKQINAAEASSGAAGQGSRPPTARQVFAQGDMGCRNYIGAAKPAASVTDVFVELRWTNGFRAVDYQLAVDGVVVSDGSMKGPDIDGQGGLIELHATVPSGATWKSLWTGHGDDAGGADFVLGDCSLSATVWVDGPTIGTPYEVVTASNPSVQRENNQLAIRMDSTGISFNPTHQVGFGAHCDDAVAAGTKMLGQSPETAIGQKGTTYTWDKALSFFCNSSGFAGWSFEPDSSTGSTLAATTDDGVVVGDKRDDHKAPGRVEADNGQGWVWFQASSGILYFYHDGVTKGFQAGNTNST